MQHKINIFLSLIILNFVFVQIRTECLTDIGSCVNSKCPDRYECNAEYKCCYTGSSTSKQNPELNLTQISQKTDDFLNGFRKILQGIFSLEQ
uniref:Uncharacterized protein n=1 Tax=Meloidogyne enterolobii TaxID=390850 RepID=A0A6V7UY41_MELEN|nr:unnamed protein product [Meloidogyne enterolobii]